jgi:hypothetical protein
MNPDCDLTSTLRVELAASSGEPYCKCIHCGVPHAVERTVSDTGETAFSVVGLLKTED